MQKNCARVRLVRRGFSLIELLFTMAMLVVLMGIVSYSIVGRAHSDKNGPTAKKPLDRADDIVCTNNLSQIRQAITIKDMDLDGKHPASLNEITGFPQEMFSCSSPPHEPYVYDPETGKVRCTHPGHEKY